MSEFQVRVVRVGALEKNPNADRLWVTKVPGTEYVVQVSTGEFNEGDLAVYVPFDSVVPCTDPRWGYLSKWSTPVMDPPGYRIRATRLKGIFSMGVYTKPLPGMQEGDDVAGTLGIRKYVSDDDADLAADNERDPGFLPCYTDIAGLRAFPDILVPGEQVVITEKIHGETGRYLWKDGRLWIGSGTAIKKAEIDNPWTRVGRDLHLEDRLKAFPDMALYGEVGGHKRGFRYTGNTSYHLFDVMNVNIRRFLDYDQFEAFVAELGLPTAPVLYRGPWSLDLLSHADGKSTLPGVNHIREGFVVRPVVERFDPRVQRVILKRHGEEFLLKF